MPEVERVRAAAGVDHRAPAAEPVLACAWALHLTGAETFRRLYPKMGGFASDPDYYTVLALEQFDPDAQTATMNAQTTVLSGFPGLRDTKGSRIVRRRKLTAK